MNDLPGPGTVRVVLSGRAPDLIKTIIFLDRVTSGDSPAEVLRVLHLGAIRIASETGRGQRVTLTLELAEAARLLRPDNFPKILEYMIDKRPEADRILLAQIWGEAKHRARWRELTADEEAAAVAALRDLAAGRADLLAEAAGVMEGFGEGELDEPRARQAAGLCRLAGADEAEIQGWIEEGRRRREAARMPPHSGGLRLPGQ